MAGLNPNTEWTPGCHALYNHNWCTVTDLIGVTPSR